MSKQPLQSVHHHFCNILGTRSSDWFVLRKKMKVSNKLYFLQVLLIPAFNTQQHETFSTRPAGKLKQLLHTSLYNNTDCSRLRSGLRGGSSLQLIDSSSSTVL